MGEVKLLLKGSSEQAKLKILQGGHVDEAQADFYKDALRKFDSVELDKYKKNNHE
jgi:hypothetical protein